MATATEPSCCAAPPAPGAVASKATPEQLRLMAGLPVERPRDDRDDKRPRERGHRSTVAPGTDLSGFAERAAASSRTSAFSWDTFKTMLAAGGAAGFCGGAATTLALRMRGVRSALSDRAMIVTIGICCPALLAAHFTRLSLAPPGPRVRVTPALGE